jgi:hypothetical protein
VTADRTTPEELRDLAVMWARNPGTYHTLVPALRAAADTIEALTAERDALLARIRQEVATGFHDNYAGFCLRCDEPWPCRAFLARTEKEKP